MQELICQNITELETPVGYFFVSDGNVNVPFSIRKNSFNVPYQIYADNQQVIDELNTETNYDLVIDVNNLKTELYYTIGFSRGTFSYGGADEHTESIVTTIDNWSLGIGAYNPNDEEEIEQSTIWHITEFDETKFVRYTVSLATIPDGKYLYSKIWLGIIESWKE